MAARDGRIWVVEDRVDGWIHDRSPAIIVSADPACNVLRVRDKASHARGRGRIPARHPREHWTVDPPACKWAHPRRTEIGIELIPRVAHRRMAVTDVPRAAGRDHRFRRAVARADHQVIGIEIELLDCGREERQVATVLRSGEGKSLDDGGGNAVALDRGRYRPARVKQREDVRVGVELAQRLEDLLAPAHSGQPVMGECNLHECRPPTSR